MVCLQVPRNSSNSSSSGRLRDCPHFRLPVANIFFRSEEAARFGFSHLGVPVLGDPPLFPSPFRSQVGRRAARAASTPQKGEPKVPTPWWLLLPVQPLDGRQLDGSSCEPAERRGPRETAFRLCVCVCVCVCVCGWLGVCVGVFMLQRTVRSSKGVCEEHFAAV